MKLLWNHINSKNLYPITKHKLFLFLNMVVWMFISLCICLIIGFIYGMDSMWLEISFIVVSYISIGVGFLGGYLFLSNHT